MLTRLIILICVQLINGQYGNKYRPLASENIPFSSEEEITYRRPETRNFKQNDMKIEFDDFDNIDDEFTNELEPKSTNTLIEEVHQTISEIKIKLGEDFKRITSLDQQNQEKAKKTTAETRAEIDDRIAYVDQLLYKKRESAAGSHSNVMHCVTDSLAKLGRITPELMKDEERCVSSELDMSRAMGKVTLDILKEHLHKVKVQQERLNKCHLLHKRKKICLINVLNELARFKRNMKAIVPAKVTETVSFLTGLPSRMRTCSLVQISKVVSRAGDVVVKFNTCVKNLSAEGSHKKKAELLLFVV